MPLDGFTGYQSRIGQSYEKCSYGDTPLKSVHKQFACCRSSSLFVRQGSWQIARHDFLILCRFVTSLKQPGNIDALSGKKFAIHLSSADHLSSNHHMRGKWTGDLKPQLLVVTCWKFSIILNCIQCDTPCCVLVRKS